MGLLVLVSPKAKLAFMSISGRLTTVSPATYWLVLRVLLRFCDR